MTKKHATRYRERPLTPEEQAEIITSPLDSLSAHYADYIPLHDDIPYIEFLTKTSQGCCKVNACFAKHRNNKTVQTMVARLMAFDKAYPEILQPEFLDFLDIVEMGAKKHGKSNWLNPDGNKSSNKDMHDSMFHHLAESYVGGTLEKGRPEDRESSFPPELHLACRALMVHIRRTRDIYHPDDSKS